MQNSLPLTLQMRIKLKGFQQITSESPEFASGRDISPKLLPVIYSFSFFFIANLHSIFAICNFLIFFFLTDHYMSQIICTAANNCLKVRLFRQTKKNARRESLLKEFQIKALLQKKIGINRIESYVLKYLVPKIKALTNKILS